MVPPLDFFKLLWGALWGFVFFGDLPGVLTWLGGAVIFLSTTYLALREAR